VPEGDSKVAVAGGPLGTGVGVGAVVGPGVGVAVGATVGAGVGVAVGVALLLTVKDRPPLHRPVPEELRPWTQNVWPPLASDVLGVNVQVVPEQPGEAGNQDPSTMVPAALLTQRKYSVPPTWVQVYAGFAPVVPLGPRAVGCPGGPPGFGVGVGAVVGIGVGVAVALGAGVGVAVGAAGVGVAVGVALLLTVKDRPPLHRPVPEELRPWTQKVWPPPASDVLGVNVQVLPEQPGEAGNHDPRTMVPAALLTQRKYSVPPT
jgi:hypothetical protein